MTNVSTDNRPNPWAVMNDFTKTVITLSSGLLVITVTFLNQLLKSNVEASAGIILAGMWVSLILSMLAGLLAAAFTINYLKYGKRGNLAIFAANTAFFLLLLAGMFMGWFGIKRLTYSSKEMDIPAAIGLAQESLNSTTNQYGTDWVVTNLSLDEANNTYILDLQDTELDVEYSIVINRSSKAVEQIELIERGR